MSFTQGHISKVHEAIRAFAGKHDPAIGGNCLELIEEAGKTGIVREAQGAQLGVVPALEGLDVIHGDEPKRDFEKFGRLWAFAPSSSWNRDSSTTV